MVLVAGLGALAGAGVSIALQSAGEPKSERRAAPHVKRAAEAPGIVLAWVPGGMPSGFAAGARRLPSVGHATIVRSGIAWLTRSRSASGSVIDDPKGGFAIPLEVAGVDPKAYADFVPPADRGVLADIASGEVALGESSAKLRGLSAGAILKFGDVSAKVAAVLPDELMGAHEVLASDDTARRLGVTLPRYALVTPKAGAGTGAVARELAKIKPPGQPMQIRTPGETPYFRMGDAVLPQVAYKQVFGEFAARPAGGGRLVVDPVWQKRYIATRRVAILGRVTCNREIMPQLEGALAQIEKDGLAHFISASDYGGCYSPRFLNNDPALGISHHAWGAAIDINVAQNPFGGTPHQNAGVVRDFADWGFTWGGNWMVPDGMHFEYIGPPRGVGDGVQP